MVRFIPFDSGLGTIRQPCRTKQKGYKMELLTKSGKLTAYAFACGYLETIGEWRLYKDGVYHLQKLDGSQWLTFATLTEARKYQRGN